MQSPFRDWSRGERLTFWSVLATIGCLLAGLLVVPEFRTLVGLDGQSQEQKSYKSVGAEAPSRSSINLTPRGSAKSTVRVCTLKGDSQRGFPNWNKLDRCIIPDLEYLDPSYRQGNFECCNNGGASEATDADIPPGLELETSGLGPWSVSSIRYKEGVLSLTTSCQPDEAFGYCRVEVDVIAHYIGEEASSLTNQ